MPRRWLVSLPLLAIAAAMLVVWRGPGDARVARTGAMRSGGTDWHREEGGVRHEPVARPGVLFTWATPANALALDAALPAPSRDVHYVRLNSEWLASKQSPFWQSGVRGRFNLPLGNGTSATVIIDGSEMLGAERWVSTGHIEGSPQSVAIFAYNRGFLHGSVEDPQLGKFALRAATANLAQFYRIDPSLVPPCGGERRPTVDAMTRAADARRVGALDSPTAAAAVAGAIGTTGGAPASVSASNPQQAEVHVLMLYTQSVLPTLSGAARTAALQSAYDAAIAKANAAFAASQISARVRLVGIAETQYDETVSGATHVQDDALTALQTTDDGKMDEIHALRDQLGADIVCLSLNRADFVSSGLSFLLDTPNDLANPRFAFSVVQYSAVAGTNVVAHEFGHVFGCAHDRENALSGPGAYSYSYGYRFIGADGAQYHDIMSYPPGSELSYFSNPNVTLPLPVGAAVGVAPGRPGESDTALTIEQDAFAVSTFRLQAIAPASSGQLVQVATRAYVGPGEQVLISGFVVDGAAPKRLLIRAAGPGLAAFGVGNVLADPTLTVFAGSRPIAANDNWSAQPGGGELVTMAAQVGAFPFPGGSADAALVVTLGPGAYTAVVEGARGSTGTALTEVYDVDRGAGRLINVASRGFADRNGREMVGTFFVQAGAPGGSADAPPTKRILIRVLGPSLERAPYRLTSALDDPVMEVRNAAGDLLIVNDDWSSGSRPVGGATDDFQPTVRYYTEQQISMTGLAPANRREPAVLVDLPPGTYSVVVAPFEQRSTDPNRDEPAVPGVGIIEVYEIK